MSTIPSNQSAPHQRGVFLLLGPSGSGKGTLAKHWLETGVISSHISMGDLLRGLLEHVQNDDRSRAELELQFRADLPTGFDSGVRALEHAVQNGLLIPNAWTNFVIERELERRRELRTQTWVIDGYPRRIPAAQQLLEHLRKLEIPVLGAVHLQLSLEEMTTRLLARGRSDDTIQAIKNRYQFYLEHVLPTLAWLESRVPILDVNAARTVQEISVRIMDAAGRVSHESI
jgi:adenylate kinase family enzyme